MVAVVPFGTVDATSTLTLITGKDAPAAKVSAAFVRAQLKAEVVASGVPQVQPVPEADSIDMPAGRPDGVSVIENGPTAVSLPALLLTVSVHPFVLF